MNLAGDQSATIALCKSRSFEARWHEARSKPSHKEPVAIFPREALAI